MIVAGNWKMYGGPDPRALAGRLAGVLGVEAIVCPPFTGLAACVEAGLTTYAQNVHWEAEGAYTGEISAPMLLGLGVAGSLVGHSERRQFFGETDEGVARRARAALDAGLRVIACVGETQAEREGGETEQVLRRQVAVLGLHERLVVAYEPVWAIGTGLTATPEMAQEAHAFIKTLLDAPVLYGGSVKPDNAAKLMAQPDVDGALVGGASLDIESFAAICEWRPQITFPLVTLVILDGWGCAPPGPGNAVDLADTPVFDRLWAEYPHTTLAASGEAVGLPPGQMGNSEVGHLTIGSGRVLDQDFQRVNRSVATGSLFENEALVSAFRRARERGGDMHLLGLVSHGGVHSHIDHVRALLELARREGMAEHTWIHAFTDGRDVSPHSAVSDLAELPVDRIATVAGRYYAMDRDKRWERTQLALDAIVAGEGRTPTTRSSPCRRATTPASPTSSSSRSSVAAGRASTRRRTPPSSSTSAPTGHGNCARSSARSKPI